MIEPFEHAEDVDPLEAELASLRPQPLSQGLRSKIGSCAHGPDRGRSTFAIVGFAVAACAVVVVSMWARHSTTTIPLAIAQTRPIPEGSRDVTAAGLPFPSPLPPTVMDYRRAFAESSAAFDAMLARPAGRGRPGETRAADPVSAFSRSAQDLISPPTTSGGSL